MDASGRAGIFVPGFEVTIERDEMGFTVRRSDGEPMDDAIAEAIMKRLAEKICPPSEGR